MKNIRCLLGMHEDEIVYLGHGDGHDDPGWDMTCKRCGRQTHTTFDMYYGKFVRSAGHYWKTYEERKFITRKLKELLNAIETEGWINEI